jgi:hypothetical protein
MIITCTVCKNRIHLTPYVATQCNCGARYCIQFITSNNTAPLPQQSYVKAHPQRQDKRAVVPKAFYDAFDDEE